MRIEGTAGDRHVLVYGASGHTGRFVVAELRRRGVHFAIAGRDGARLAEQGAALDAIAWYEARIDDHAALDHALRGAGVVINCAGPYLDTAPALIQAAVRNRVHYLDLTAEQESARSTLAEWDEPASAAGVTVIPAAAFFGGFADLLATSLLSPRTTADEIITAIALDSWNPTEGTRATGARNTFERVVVRDGALMPVAPDGAYAEWLFPEPFGMQVMLEVPLSEIITLHRHLKSQVVRTFLNSQSIADLRNPATAAPAAADADGRSAQQWVMDVVVRSHGTSRRARASGRDIYASSAPFVVEAADQLLRDASIPRGAVVVGEAFGATEFLQNVSGRAISISWDEVQSG